MPPVCGKGTVTAQVRRVQYSVAQQMPMHIQQLESHADMVLSAFVANCVLARTGDSTDGVSRGGAHAAPQAAQHVAAATSAAWLDATFRGAVSRRARSNRVYWNAAPPPCLSAGVLAWQQSGRSRPPPCCPPPTPRRRSRRAFLSSGSRSSRARRRWRSRRERACHVMRARACLRARHPCP